MPGFTTDVQGFTCNTEWHLRDGIVTWNATVRDTGGAVCGSPNGLICKSMGSESELEAVVRKMIDVMLSRGIRSRRYRQA